MLIFISYSATINDVSQLAKELKTNLEAKPYVAEVFICEEDIPAYVIRRDYITKKISDCDIFIPIITQEYLDSKQCYQEILEAHYINKKYIFPILIQDCKLEYENVERACHIQFIVSQFQCATFKTTEVEQDTFDKSLAAIKQTVLGE